MQATCTILRSLSKFQRRKKLSAEMLIEVVKLVALEKNELQLQKDTHAYQKFNNLSQSHLP